MNNLNCHYCGATGKWKMTWGTYGGPWCLGIQCTECGVVHEIAQAPKHDARVVDLQPVESIEQLIGDA